MTHILRRQTDHSYPVAATARGVIIHDSAGKEYIDHQTRAIVVARIRHQHDLDAVNSRIHIF
jgi:4-aminobutyrate aminotransferase-like enzyme